MSLDPGPYRCWWHSPFGCGAEVVSSERPTECKCGMPEPRFEDLGWRVGFNNVTYSYYTSREHAAKDKRVKT